MYKPCINEAKLAEKLVEINPAFEPRALVMAARLHGLLAEQAELIIPNDIDYSGDEDGYFTAVIVSQVEALIYQELGLELEEDLEDSVSESLYRISDIMVPLFNIRDRALLQTLIDVTE